MKITKEQAEKDYYKACANVKKAKDLVEVKFNIYKQAQQEEIDKLKKEINIKEGEK